MSATLVWRAVLISLLLTPWLAAQAGGAPTSTTSCNLDDGRQVYVRYNPVANSKEKLANGKPWTPGGAPIAQNRFSEVKANEIASSWAGRKESKCSGSPSDWGV